MPSCYGDPVAGPSSVALVSPVGVTPHRRRRLGEESGDRGRLPLGQPGRGGVDVRQQRGQRGEHRLAECSLGTSATRRRSSGRASRRR